MGLVRAKWIARACALALTVPCAAAGLEFGTLFHTPQERERFDRLRRGEPAEAPDARPTRGPVVTGYVRRSDGRNTVWIDGRPVVVTTPKAAPLLDPGKVSPRNPPGPESSPAASPPSPENSPPPSPAPAAPSRRPD